MTSSTLQPALSTAAANDPFAVRDANLIFADQSHLPQDQQDYLFEVNGCRVLHQVLDADTLAAIHQWVDRHNPAQRTPGEWIGDVEIHSYGSKDGVNFQNILAAGRPFTTLIDHHAWIDLVSRYIVTPDHRLAIDENFLNVRESGGFIPIHSGGATRRLTSSFRALSGQWAVGQINILMALTDVGPGDGATTVVPGSHKAAIEHPQRDGAWTPGQEVGGDQAAGMTEVHLRAGDALMFTDALCHGSMPRTNPGQRRVMIYRYSPHLLAARHHYLPAPEFLDTLTDRQRQMVLPIPPRFAPGRTLKAEDYRR